MASRFQALDRSQQAEKEKIRTALIKHDEEKLKFRVGLALLESLRFPTMNYRHETVAEAHAQTFEWIFRQTTNTL
jgi:hypothetical protein